MRLSSAEQETSLFSFPLLNLQGRQLHSRRLKGEMGEALLQLGQWKPAEGGSAPLVFGEIYIVAGTYGSLSRRAGQ